MMLPAWALWIAGGLLLLAAEMLLPGVFLVWVGLAAVAAGLAVMTMELGFASAVALFLAALALGVGIAMTRRRAAPRVNAPDTGLVGRVGLLLSDEPAGARMRLGDSDWPARLLEPAAPGAAVVVTGVDGTTLLVRPQHKATGGPA